MAQEAGWRRYHTRHSKPERDVSRHILGQGNPDDPITVTNAREGLVPTTGDQVDLTKGQEKAPYHVVRNLSRAVANIDQATPSVGTHHAKRGVTEEDPSGDNTITFGRRLESDARGTIPQELNSGDGVLAE